LRKNPVSLDLRAGGQKPGFCENTSLKREDLRKNPVSLDLRAGGQKPGFCENTSLKRADLRKNPVSLAAVRKFCLNL